MESKFKFSESYVVIDTETTIKNVGDDAVGTNKASAFNLDNRIVAIGALNEELEYTDNYFANKTEFSTGYPTSGIPQLWVGQNIKFDMHHLFMGDKDFQYGIFPHIQIWDTQLAEYLLTGQESQYASLDHLATKYGGTLKNDVIKAMWDEGVQTEDMDKNLLLPYLEDDVRNTHCVFDRQLIEADKIGMLPLILSQMNALKCTIEMEYNGMYFNRGSAVQISNEIQQELDTINMELDLIVHDGMHFSKLLNFNPKSSKQVALVLFGGEYKFEVVEDVKNPDGSTYLYKTGKRKGEVKTTKVTKSTHNDGFGITVIDKWKTAKGSISTADDVLNELLNLKSSTAAPFITLLLKHRNLSKQLNTYFVGYSNLTWPTDSCIHQSLNHTATATGRLSSSKPNLQNVTNKGD